MRIKHIVYVIIYKVQFLSVLHQRIKRICVNSFLRDYTLAL